MEVVINLQEKGQIEAVKLLKGIWNWKKIIINLPACTFYFTICLFLSIFWKMALHIRYTIKSKILWIAKSQIQPIRMQWPLYVYILASIGTYVGPKLGLKDRFLSAPWAFKWMKGAVYYSQHQSKICESIMKEHLVNVFKGCFLLHVYLDELKISCKNDFRWI